MRWEDPALIRRHTFALSLVLLATDAAMAVTLFLVLGALRFGDAEWTTMWHAWGQDDRLGALFYATA